MKKNFFLKFNTPNNNSYLYDGVTSVVMPDDGVIEDIITLRKDGLSFDEIDNKLKDKYQEMVVTSAKAFVKRWEKNYGGFLIDTEAQSQITEATPDIIGKYLDMGELYLMVLSVTEDCNFRCKYCYLSETYDYTRNRTNNRMTVETAKKAVDYYFDLIRKYQEIKPDKTANINFFGGEPLLEMDLVREVVEYAKKTTPVKLSFDITTNGYLLTEDVMDYLVENDFYIAVSLDGDKNNNSNRVMGKDVDTFERVVENVKKFREKYPLYIKFGVLSVYDIKTDMDKNVEFFSDKSLPPVLRVTGAATNNTTYYEKFSPADYEKFNATLDKLRKDYIYKKSHSQPMSSYLQVLFETELFQIVMRRRHKDDRGTLVPYTGTCIPGIRLGVRTDGTLDICERMNQEFSIGSISSGYDYESIAKVINQYNHDITGSCSDCIANKICSICYANVAGNNEFNHNSKDCAQIRNFLQKGCSVVYGILEENPGAFTKEEYQKVIENSLMFEG